MKYIENYKDTLFGSMVEAIGIICHKGPSSRYRLFYNLMHWNGPIYSKTTISEILEYIWSIYGNDKYKKDRHQIKLLIDKYNVRSPMVGIIKDGGIITYSDNPSLITLYKEGREYIEVEDIYDEQGELIT